MKRDSGETSCQQDKKHSDYNQLKALFVFRLWIIAFFLYLYVSFLFFHMYFTGTQNTFLSSLMFCIYVFLFYLTLRLMHRTTLRDKPPCCSTAFSNGTLNPIININEVCLSVYKDIQNTVYELTYLANYILKCVHVE